MPFKSEAQRKKIYSLEAQGKLKKGTAAAWEAETPKGALPARVSAPRRSSRVREVKEIPVKKFGRK